MNFLIARAEGAVTARFGIWSSRCARAWKGDPCFVLLMNLRIIERRVQQGGKVSAREVHEAVEWARKNSVDYNMSLLYHS